jgi:hypothetical protein
MQEVEWCASTTLTIASLSSVVQLGLVDERDMMGPCKLEALSGAMADLPRAMQISILKMD